MTPEEELKKRINDLEIYQKNIESQLLEQEHRPFTVIKNYLNRDKWVKGDKRRKSVRLAILWRLFFSPTTMAVTGGAIGFITIFILIWQNQLLINQNKLTTYQNNLIEAERRSAQVFVMSDVLQDLQKELTQKDRPKDSTISNVLAGRIVAVSRAMKPYRILQADTLSNLISPERGQLLITLKNAGINKKQLNSDILTTNKGNFTYAELINADLSGLNLTYSDLKNADLTSADLLNANLFGVNFEYANLTDADLRYSDMKHSILTDASLFDADLRFADLRNANLVGADIRYVDFWNANLTDVDLRFAIVTRKDWISYINKDLTIKGGKQIDSLYSVVHKKTFSKDSIFQIVLKNRKRE